MQEREIETHPGREHQRGDLSESLAKTMVTSSKDAMGLLFQAADQPENDSTSDDDESEEPMDVIPAGRDGKSDATSPLLSSESRLPSQFSEEKLALWNRHRFVVQGWFSAHEAISYLQLWVYNLC